MLAQYYPINSRDEGGNGPAPMALGKYGLAEAAQIIRDGVKHMFYGNNQILAAEQWAQRQTPTLTVQRNVSKPISQARGYLDLFRAQFHNGKPLASFAKNGCPTQCAKGNVAVISIKCDDGAGGNSGLPAGAVKGALVKQSPAVAASSVPQRDIVGTLCEDVSMGDTIVKVSLLGPHCNALNSSKRCMFKTGSKKKPLSIIVDDDDPVTVDTIDVQRAHVAGIDPRCSPFVPVPKHCDIFLALSQPYREAVYYIDCLDCTYEAMQNDWSDIEEVKLWLALPTKVLRTEKLNPFGDIDAAAAKQLRGSCILKSLLKYSNIAATAMAHKTISILNHD